MQKARELMATKVFTVTPDLSVIELEREFNAQRISGAPVVERGKLVGIVSRSDIDRRITQERSGSAGVATYYWDPEVREDDPRAASDVTSAALDRFKDLRVRDLMTRDVISVEPDAPIRDVARLMIEKKIHRVLVIDDGSLAGLISSLDLVRVLASDSS
jgi:CBS domain-containing protein